MGDLDDNLLAYPTHSKQLQLTARFINAVDILLILSYYLFTCPSPLMTLISLVSQDFVLLMSEPQHLGQHVGDGSYSPPICQKNWHFVLLWQVLQNWAPKRNKLACCVFCSGLYSSPAALPVQLSHTALITHFPVTFVRNCILAPVDFCHSSPSDWPCQFHEFRQAAKEMEIAFAVCFSSIRLLQAGFPQSQLLDYSPEDSRPGQWILPSSQVSSVYRTAKK